jgi:hypothetical protein
MYALRSHVDRGSWEEACGGACAIDGIAKLQTKRSTRIDLRITPLPKRIGLVTGLFVPVPIAMSAAGQKIFIDRQYTPDGV